MRAELYWIKAAPQRLAVMPKPRGGEWLRDEVQSLQVQGVSILVSLLTPDEAAELQLGDEPGLCAAVGVTHVSFPIADRSVPQNQSATADLVRRLIAELRNGSGVAIHCRSGIGRSALVAACVLVGMGWSPMDAFKEIGAARGCTVPDTPEQHDWVMSFAC